jgi:hypothetical protein
MIRYWCGNRKSIGVAEIPIVVAELLKTNSGQVEHEFHERMDRQEL